MTANRGEGPGGSGTFERRLLLAVDAKGYGGTDSVTQRQFQEEITRLLDRAAAAARLDRAGWLTQEGGDSVFAVLPETAYEPALIDTFMRALDAGLRAFNQNRIPQARLRLRAAVHFGPASPGANGFVGPAPVEIGRILDSSALRTALDESPDACLAVGVSATVFRDVVKEAHTTIPAVEFRRVSVAEKEYRGEAWIWVAGAGAGRSGAEPTAPPPTATPPTATPPTATPPSPGEAPPDIRSEAGGEGRAAEEAVRQQPAARFVQNVTGGTGIQAENATVTITQTPGTAGDRP
ncbi:hypothetical protein ACGF5O_19300 [Streptomyces sp. NPDC048291]|uniref:hypothetical protein n=1 Tax=Streptomyces sp. NPDC048291 TaxID=3365530 RepID=UPI00371816D0